MNDPHIVALHYRVMHEEYVDYEKAHALTHDEAGFAVRVEDGRAEITMKSHYATVDDARTEVEPFLRAWELTAALQFGPGEFRFAYDRATIIDRNPTPGATIHAAVGIDLGSATATATAHIGRSKYPAPPVGIARDVAVELMFERYCRYRAGGTTLADAANFCLTVLKTSAAGGRRRDAGTRYAVAKAVLSKLGDLAANKGGNEARKAGGAHAAYTAAERHWLEETIKRIILRAGEVACDPSAARPQIAMTDLPSLTG